VSGRLFFASGPAEVTASLDLDIAGLRKVGCTFRGKGYLAPYLRRDYEGIGTPIAPSEHFVAPKAWARWKRTILAPKVEPIIWPRKLLRVAIGQLKPLPDREYLETAYRIHKSERCSQFETSLIDKLSELEKRCSADKRTERGALLDILVLPEVLVPRSFESSLQAFADRTRAIVVAGFGYSDNLTANECRIMRPFAKPITYRKITKSQYDGRCAPERNGFFGFLKDYVRGTRLLRFEDASNDGRGFGVLVCYDFSHQDIVHAINLSLREKPLDLLIVIANNPFGESYRSACIADANRFYQYVAMCNISTYGGSGLFGPLRLPGARQVIAETGKGAEGILLADLNLVGLREARSKSNRKLRSEGPFQCKPGVFQRRYSLVAS
jgi:predicted amidohydrolase